MRPIFFVSPYDTHNSRFPYVCTSNGLAVNPNVESRIKNLQALPGVGPIFIFFLFSSLFLSGLVFQSEENLTIKFSVHRTTHYTGDSTLV